MKLFVLPDLCLGQRSMQSALDAAFSPAMLARVHGPSLQLAGPGGFDAAGRRNFRFSVDVTGVPPAIRGFIGGDRLDVSVRQTVDRRGPADWRVSNRLRLKCVGAELIKVRPAFVLRQGGDGRVVLSASVRHDAVLPPPLNGIAEEFMMLNTAREMQRFEGELRAAGEVETPQAAAPALQSFPLHVQSFED